MTSDEGLKPEGALEVKDDLVRRSQAGFRSMDE